MKGSCLCGDVRYEVFVDQLKMYQCHCDLCRKQSGTASSCGAVVAASQFRWLSGEEQIHKWEKETGFTSHFCAQCGSSVPNAFKGRPFYWVPVGALEGDHIDTVVNLFVSEKPGWSNVDSSQNPYESRPEVEELLRLLHVEKV